MLGKTPDKHQVTIFQTPLVNFINMDHELVHLDHHIDWDEVEYEFWNKSSIAKTKSGIIVGAMAFKGNPFDGHTLPEQLQQIKRFCGMTIENALVDRGYRGRLVVIIYPIIKIHFQIEFTKIKDELNV